MMGLKDRIARFFVRSSTKKQINNAFKAELFRCSNKKYNIVCGKVRYWRIMKKDCYPGGCTSMDVNESFSVALSQNPLIKPTLLVPPTQFEGFIKGDLKDFIEWQQKNQHRFVSFMGVLHAVKPRFDVKMMRTRSIHFRGFILIFKECLIGNVFFNDFVYLLVSEEMQCKMSFSKTDTVSGMAFLSIDDKGMVVLSRPEKLKLVAKGIETEQVNKDLSGNMEFRLVDTFTQDACEVCPYSLVVRVRKRVVDHVTKTVKHKSSREFACTLESCILLEKKALELEEKLIEEKNEHIVAVENVSDESLKKLPSEGGELLSQTASEKIIDGVVEESEK